MSTDENREQSQLGPSDNATVMLDIGGDVGALIIYAPESMHRVEIEISPIGDAGEDVFQAGAAPHSHDGHTHSHDGGTHSHDGPARTHVAIRERRGPAGTQYAAIYPGLREGDYTIWNVDGTPADTVHIIGGEIAELDWR